MKTLGYYSIKEIKDQNRSLESLKKSYNEISIISKAAFKDNPDQVIFTGCGSSYYIAAAVSSYFIKYMDIPAVYLPCYELEIYRNLYIKDRKTLIIPFTRCSITSEVKSAIAKCRELPNVKTLAITCDNESIKYNDYVIFCADTEEKSIVMTRSFSSMLYAGMLMVDALSGRNSKNLLELPDIAKEFIPKIEQIVKSIAPHYKNYKLMVALGQGQYFGIAGESSLKIKEMCIIPTEIYFTMEYRHGPVSIADKKTICMIYTSSETSNDDLRLIKELSRLNTQVICIGENIIEDIKNIADEYFMIPNDCLPLSIVPAQYLGAYWALEKGLDPDTPRNLSKAIVL